MKNNVVISHEILKKGKDLLFHWKKSLEFIVESSKRSVNELKDVHDLAQKVTEELFEYLKVLHTKSHVSTNG